MMKIGILNAEDEIDYIRREDGITGICSEEASGGKGGFRSVTERTALFNIDNLKEKEEEIIKLKHEVAAIERALDGLTDTERQVIEARYIESYMWIKVARRVGRDERQC